MNKFRKRLYVEYADGSLAEVRTPSIEDYENIKFHFEALYSEINDEKYKNVSTEEAYRDHPKVKFHIDGICNPLKISINKLDYDTLFNLLFPHALPDGSYKRLGDLSEFIFGAPKEMPETDVVASKEQMDLYAEIMGKLLAVFDNYNTVAAMMRDLSYMDLEKVLKERAEAMKPAEEKAKEQVSKKVKSAIDALNTGALKLEVTDEEVDIDTLLS